MPAPSSSNPYSRDSGEYTHKGRGKSRGKIVVIVLVVLALVAAVGALGFYVYKEMQKSAINEDLHSMTQEEMEAVDNELTGMTTFDEPFTMLLLGSDARTDDPGLGARTDTIILVRVDPNHNIVSMVSIPRDTKIEIDGVGTAKFNAAYTYGGPSGTIAAVKELCDVDIDHYAEINFEGLVGLVDAIGGIDVMVDEAIDDPDAGPIAIPAGQQHLNGEAALVFSRSRAYVNGDFTRVSNQRKVIEAIIHKGLEAPATELYGLVRASTSFLTTDSGMDVDFIYSLADQMRHNNDDPFVLYTATIPATTGMIGDASYVIADTAGVAELMQIFMECGDVGAGTTASSIDEDVSVARNGSSATTTTTTTTTDETYYNYEEPTYYYEEVPQQTYTTEVTDTDNTAATTVDTTSTAVTTEATDDSTASTAAASAAATSADDDATTTTSASAAAATTDDDSTTGTADSDTTAASASAAATTDDTTDTAADTASTDTSADTSASTSAADATAADDTTAATDTTSSTADTAATTGASASSAKN